MTSRRFLAAGRTGGPAEGLAAVHGTRITSTLRPLQEVATVGPGTVVALLRPGEPPRVAGPGEEVRPTLWPSATTEVLVVATGAVQLDLTVPDLVAHGSARGVLLVLRLAVRLDPGERSTLLLSLLDRHHGDLEAHLLERVREEADTVVRMAFRLNRIADIRRLGAQAVLGDGWLPPTFADGALVLEGFDVLAVTEPDGQHLEPDGQEPVQPGRQDPVAQLASPGAGTASLP